MNKILLAILSLLFITCSNIPPTSNTKQNTGDTTPTYVPFDDTLLTRPLLLTDSVAAPDSINGFAVLQNGTIIMAGSYDTSYLYGFNCPKGFIAKYDKTTTSILNTYYGFNECWQANFVYPINDSSFLAGFSMFKVSQSYSRSYCYSYLQLFHNAGASADPIITLNDTTHKQDLFVFNIKKSSNGYLLCGYAPLYPDAGTGYSWLVSTDNNLATQSIFRAGASADNDIWDFTTDNLNNIYTCGSSSYYPAKHPALYKLSPSGGLVWSQDSSQPGSNSYYSMDIINNNKLILIGFKHIYTDSNDISYLVIKLVDTDGNLIWAKELGGIGHNYSGQQILIANQDSIIFKCNFAISTPTSSSWGRNYLLAINTLDGSFKWKSSVYVNTNYSSCVLMDNKLYTISYNKRSINIYSF